MCPQGRAAGKGIRADACALGAHKERLAASLQTSQPDATYETFRKGIEHTDPAISANVIIGLIRVTSFLLGKQLRSLELAFVKEGGLRERMTRARLAERAKNKF